MEHSTLVARRLGNIYSLFEFVYVYAVQSQVGFPREKDLTKVVGVAVWGVIQPCLKAVLPPVDVSQNAVLYFFDSGRAQVMVVHHQFIYRNNQILA